MDAVTPKTPPTSRSGKTGQQPVDTVFCNAAGDGSTSLGSDQTPACIRSAQNLCDPSFPNLDYMTAALTNNQPSIFYLGRVDSDSPLLQHPQTL